MSFLDKLYTPFSVGALGGALATFTFWMLGATKLAGFAILMPSLAVENFYAPMFWGGVCGLLYLLPIQWKMLYKGLAFSVIPAFIYLSLEQGGLSQITKFLDLTMLTRKDVFLALVVYFLAWGVVTQHLISKRGDI